MYKIVLNDNTCDDFTLTCECDTLYDMIVNLERIKKESTRLIREGTLTVIDLEDGLILREYTIIDREIALTFEQGE